MSRPRMIQTVFLCLTLAIGLWAIWPLRDFQYYLSTGDHGRDLYAFEQTMEGRVPYRDYEWLSGPLMPYYYALFFRLFGPTIQTALLAQNILILATGVLVYLTCALWLSPAMAMAAALWYWAFRGPEFFHTYNHIGGLVMILLTLYALLRYLKRPSLRPVVLGAAALLALLLIRLNMGLALWGAFFLGLILIDRLKGPPVFLSWKSGRVLLPAGVLLIAALVYWGLLHDQPGYIVYQSFPYGKVQRTDTTKDIIGSLDLLGHILVKNFTASWPRRLMALGIISSGLWTGCALLRQRGKPVVKEITLTLGIILIVLTASLHEFLASGVFYRLHWSVAAFFILIFYLIFWTARLGPPRIFTPIVRALLTLAFCVTAVKQIHNEHHNITAFKRGLGTLLRVGKNRVYLSQQKQWTEVVQQSVAFLKHHVPPEEAILVIPFDALYCFLAQRPCASRQLVFFEHILIPPQQENKIVEEMETKGVNWVLLSNRVRSDEPGMGTFGRTYGRILHHYIMTRFKPVARFGDWTRPGGWVYPHGTLILQRKPPLPDANANTPR